MLLQSCSKEIRLTGNQKVTDTTESGEATKSDRSGYGPFEGTGGGGKLPHRFPQEPDPRLAPIGGIRTSGKTISKVQPEGVLYLAAAVGLSR